VFHVTTLHCNDRSQTVWLLHLYVKHGWATFYAPRCITYTILKDGNYTKKEIANGAVYRCMGAEDLIILRYTGHATLATGNRPIYYSRETQSIRSNGPASDNYPEIFWFIVDSSSSKALQLSNFPVSIAMSVHALPFWSIIQHHQLLLLLLMLLMLVELLMRQAMDACTAASDTDNYWCAPSAEASFKRCAVENEF